MLTYPLELYQKIDYIKNYKNKLTIMEVCGTHTMEIGKFGIRSLLSENVRLISGPGCPVCVTPSKYIDYAYELSFKANIEIVTYGDMIRVPGSVESISLEKARALGGNIKIIYSSMDALNYAKKHRDKKVVFLAIGFETTAPATAVAIKEACKYNVKNFFVLSMHKIVAPVIERILRNKSLKIQGFLLPGNVGVIVGEKGFKFLNSYDIPGVITGFGKENIINGIYELFKLKEQKNNSLVNCYKSAVAYEGNVIAKQYIKDYFMIKDDSWRGIGVLENSSLKLRDKYSDFDIEKIYPMKDIYDNMSQCSCGKVITGEITPIQCCLFRKVCTPINPKGPCMVSSEGTCSAYYKYNV